MKRLTLVLLLSTLFGPVMAQEKYISTDLGCSLTYPSDWIRRDANFAALVLLYSEKVTEPLAENFHLEVNRMSGNIDQSMLARMDLMQLEEKFPLMKMVVSKEAPLGNIKDAQRFEMAGKHLGKNFKVLNIAGYSGNTKYTIFFGAEKQTYNLLVPKVEAAIRSFKATGK